MAVPDHDPRDWEFAKKFDLPIIEVVAGGDVEKEAFTDCATGTMVNSDFLTGLSVEEAKKKIVEWLTAEGKGHEKVNFKLRDWVFSRQRYCQVRQVRLCAAAGERAAFAPAYGIQL